LGRNADLGFGEENTKKIPHLQTVLKLGLMDKYYLSWKRKVTIVIRMWIVLITERGRKKRERQRGINI